MFRRAFSLLLLSLIASAASAEGLRLSGEIAARDSQIFVAPRGDSWQLQVAWMVEEGERVDAGDPVVQYDTASIATSVEQLETSLRQVQAQSLRSDLAQDMALRQAEHNYQIAQLQLERAQLDAGVPLTLLSELQYEEYQLALIKAESAVREAERALKVAREDVAAEKRRNQLEIAGAKNELQRVQAMLDAMTQRAASSGTAMYVDHPWTGEKIRTGDMVRDGFSVLEIPSTDDLHVRAWLNEVDVARVTENQPVKVYFDARPKLELSGVISRIGSQAEPKQYWGESGYIDIDVAIENAQDQGLLPGMSVLIVLEGEAQ